MPAAERCAVIIPCLNEAGTIRDVVAVTRRFIDCVIVVDDGSTDGTPEQAREAGAQVVRQASCRGKGAALRAGIEAAQAADAEWGVFMDGDGQHAAEDIPPLLAVAERTGADLIIGNRMPFAAAMPWLRRQVNRWMSRDLSRWTGVTIPDSQCGFRLVRIAAWQQARPRGDGFTIESDMIVAFVAAGLRIAHSPVQVLPRAREQSRIHAWRDTQRWFRWRQHARTRLTVGR